MSLSFSSSSSSPPSFAVIHHQSKNLFISYFDFISSLDVFRAIDPASREEFTSPPLKPRYYRIV